MVMRPLVAPRANGIGGIPPGAARQDIVVNGELIKEELDRKVFIGGLNWNTTKTSLHNYFRIFGEICDCVVIRHPVTRKSRGFGYVTFIDPCVLLTVLANFHCVDGTIVDVKSCNPRYQNRIENPNLKIFVGGLSRNCTEDMLKIAFSEYGKVTETTIIYEKNNLKQRGFGFVTFETESDVEKLCELKYISIDGKQVEIKRAEPIRPEAALLTPEPADPTKIVQQEPLPIPEIKPVDISDTYIEDRLGLLERNLHHEQFLESAMQMDQTALYQLQLNSYDHILPVTSNDNSIHASPPVEKLMKS